MDVGSRRWARVLLAASLILGCHPPIEAQELAYTQGFEDATLQDDPTLVSRHYNPAVLVEEQNKKDDPQGQPVEETRDVKESKSQPTLPMRRIRVKGQRDTLAVEINKTQIAPANGSRMIAIMPFPYDPRYSGPIQGLDYMNGAYGKPRCATQRGYAKCLLLPDY